VKYEEMAQSVREARQVQDVVKAFVNDFAILLAPNIRNVTNRSSLGAHEERA
jgi:hypothetical protein